MYPPLDMKTANGYDLQFGTNVLGHYLFTVCLLPVLIHTAQTRRPISLHAHVIGPLICLSSQAVLSAS